MRFHEAIGQDFYPSPIEGRWREATDEGLANGAMFESEGNFFTLKNQSLLRWSFAGYTAAIPFSP